MPTSLPTTDSINLTVGVVYAYDIDILQQPGAARGGIPFGLQPHIAVLDKGGNVLVDDSISYATVTIKNNPSKATIRSDPRCKFGPNDIRTPTWCFYLRNDALDLNTLIPQTMKLQRGVANFTSLNIDKIGREFTLLITVYADPLNYYGWTGSVSRETETFDVLHGDHTEIIVQVPPGRAWSGDRPSCSSHKWPSSTPAGTS